ncbi:MAG: AI-2E family transporter [Bdellovibrionia bacterium]
MESRLAPRIPITLIILSLLTLTLWGAREAQSFLVPLSFAALLAFIMTPLVHALRLLRIPDWLAIVISVVAVVAPIFTLGYFLSVEIDHFIRNSPAMMDTLQKHWDQISRSSFGNRFHLENVMQGSTLRQRAANEASQGFRYLLEGLHALLSLGSEVLIVILLGVVMVISRHSLRRGLDHAFDTWKMPQYHAILEESMLLIERFLVARLALVLLVALADLIILRAFHVEYFILLAVFLGVMTLIPAVGFIIALTPTLLISLISGNSLLKTIFLFAGLAVISALESHVFTPKWVGKRINLNLLTTFIGLLAGERLWGVAGMFLSLPYLAIFRILLSASPSLKPLGDLLSERDDPALAKRLAHPDKRKSA